MSVAIKLGKMVTYPECILPLESRDKLKASYLHYHNAHGHKLWQDVDLPSVNSTYKVI